MKNKLAEYKQVQDTIRNLKDHADELKAAILYMMDKKHTDTTKVGAYKACRQLILQERVDTEEVREMLGDNTPTKTVEVLKLLVM